MTFEWWQWTGDWLQVTGNWSQVTSGVLPYLFFSVFFSRVGPPTRNLLLSQKYLYYADQTIKQIAVTYSDWLTGASAAINNYLHIHSLFHLLPLQISEGAGSHSKHKSDNNQHVWPSQFAGRSVFHRHTERWVKSTQIVSVCFIATLKKWVSKIIPHPCFNNVLNLNMLTLLK